MFANGQAVKRALLVNTTANATRLYTQPSLSLTFARVVRRLSAGWTLSTDTFVPMAVLSAEHRIPSLLLWRRSHTRMAKGSVESNTRFNRYFVTDTSFEF